MGEANPSDRGKIIHLVLAEFRRKFNLFLLYFISRFYIYLQLIVAVRFPLNESVNSREIKKICAF